MDRVDLGEILAGGALAGGLLAIAAIDIKTQRIPDFLSFPMMAAGLVTAYWYSPLPFYDHVLGLMGGYCVLAGLGQAYFAWRGHEGLGLGDAKLLGAAGAWLGWAKLPFVILAASCLGLIFAITQRKTLQARIAFGPFLAAGFWLTWAMNMLALQGVWR